MVYVFLQKGCATSYLDFKLNDMPLINNLFLF